MTEIWEQIHVIGIDDGGGDTLAANDQRLIDNAELLCGGQRHLALFPNARAEPFCIKNNLEDLYAVLRSAAGRRVVVLASGDPCFYGIGPLLVDQLGAARVAIHPHPSSVSIAFARLGLSWHDAAIVSAHGRPVEDAVAAARGAAKLAILTDPQHTPAVIAKAMLTAGIDDCPAHVCENLGGPHERIQSLRLVDLPPRTFDPVNVLVLLPSPPSPCVPAFGRSDSDYESVRGQLTKSEVRAATVAYLEPWRASVAWDVGAGSGSVAIELAGLMPAGTVFAVERDPEQLAVLERNAARFAARRVRIIAGAAPAALEPLPDPDLIFVGGSGASLLDILQSATRRLQPGGRLVANFARLDSLTIWQTVAAELGWPQRLTQMSVTRGVPVGDGTRLQALSPVFITRLDAPERPV